MPCILPPFACIRIVSITFLVTESPKFNELYIGYINCANFPARRSYSTVRSRVIAAIKAKTTITRGTTQVTDGSTRSTREGLLARTKICDHYYDNWELSTEPKTVTTTMIIGSFSLTEMSSRYSWGLNKQIIFYRKPSRVSMKKILDSKREILQTVTENCGVLGKNIISR